MYKFRRLRALLQTLSVTTKSRRQPLLRWLWVGLGYAVAIGVALAEIFKTSHDWPVTWHDVLLRDEVARSFVLSAFVAFVSGCYMLMWLLSSGRLATRQMLPLPALAPALRQAARDCDTRVVSTAQPERPAQEYASDAALAATSVVVATPQLLTSSGWLAIGVFSAGMVPLAMVAMFLQSIVSTGFAPQPGLVGGASVVYTMLRLAGVFAPLVVIAFVYAGRYWVGWRAKVRGAHVTVSAQGLTIRDYATRWRRRYVAWRDVVSFVCFTYKDGYTHPRTVYLLDGGSQTFLWETPPDMRYDPAARRQRIAGQQAESARLVALVAAATRLPLLDISSVISAVAKIEPNPYTASEEPDPRDIELLEFVEGVSSPKTLKSLAPPLIRAEQWRRGLLSGLVGIAFVVGSVLFFGWLGQ